MAVTLKAAVPEVVNDAGEVITPAKDAVLFKYGQFINTIISFLIVTFSIFLVIKGLNKMKRKKEEAPAAPAEPSAEEKLLTEIRDLLKEKK